MSDTVHTGKSLLIVVLNDVDSLGNAILALTGVSGGLVTMIDAVGGSHNLSRSIPLFAIIAGSDVKRYGKILITCVEGCDSASRFTQFLAESGFTPQDLGIGEIHSVPLSEAYVIDEFNV